MTRRFSLYTLGLFAVVLVAVLVRVWFWSWQATAGAVQPGDPEEYYRAALHLMEGGYHDTGKWLRPPVYPIFLALSFTIAGIDLRWALLAQALVTGVGILAFVWLARRLFASQAIGLLSGLLAALFVPFASFSSVLFAEAIFVMLIVLALVLVDRTIEDGDWRWALVAGLVLAMATLTRAVSLLFIPMAGLLMLLWAKPPAKPKGMAGRLLAPAALALGAALLISPWALRNYLVHERLILVDTNGGISMWFGTVQGEADRIAGEAAIFGLPNLADRQALAVEMTLERFREDPLFHLVRARYKIASLFLLQSRSYAVGDVVTISPTNEQIVLSAGENPRPLSLLADAQYIFIMLGGIAGLSFAPSWRRTTPLLLWFGLGVLLSAITIGHHRLRLPLVAIFVPFCAYALWRIPMAWRALRQGLSRPQWMRVGLMLTGWLVFFALIFSTRYITWISVEQSASVGRQALAQGDFATAEAAFLTAHAADPENSLRALALADLAMLQGDHETALEWFVVAREAEPRSLYALAMESWLATMLGDQAAAEAAHNEIIEFGRDTNDFYTWAWSATPTPPDARVIPGATAALGHFVGFAPITPDLTEGRWTLGSAQVRVGGSGCNELQVDLRGPAGRPVTLEAVGVIQTVTLSGSEQRLILPLGAGACLPDQPLVLSITSPRSLLDLEAAPWNVGVAVLAVERDS
ncbi:glycosyltransferase family 39 protein [Candidatus Viridilinea mediisalina]|uniref:Glycosyltransferase RgtA/B/C/D-like domain-containing protein n=1 Tax=Candidatus Viridilinea mediisalina TaxID=2024553 RepID=A0A2A6RLF3_9CHLR|nr:glycosyltransferase family 39 protein [Candidatus Viridilinea mediisalina]PDW03726.1 hypothetical protein CJ255_07410 [Candidatus Viridilinea mediisalina]